MPRVIVAGLVVFAALFIVFIANPPDENGVGSWRTTNNGSAIDDPGSFVANLLDAATLAGWLFIVASGFSLIFGLMRVVNMAHGAFYLLGGYIAYEVQQRMTGGHSWLHPGRARQHVGVAGADGRRDGLHRRPWPRRPAGLLALEPGTGSPPGSDHDCDRGDHRRPGDRPLPEVRRIPDGRWQPRHDHVAGLDGAEDRPARRGRELLVDAARDPRTRRHRRRPPVALASPHANGSGHSRGSGRPPDDLRARHQHPADVRHRIRGRVVARGGRRNRRRLAGRRHVRAGRSLAALFADRRDRRRHGIAPGCRRRLGARRASCLTFSASYLPSTGNPAGIECCTQYSITFTFVLIALVLAFRPQGLFGKAA